MLYNPRFWFCCLACLSACTGIQGQGVFQGGFDHFEGTGASGCNLSAKVNPTSSNPFSVTNIFTCPDAKVTLVASVNIVSAPSTSSPTGDGQMFFLNGEMLRTTLKFTATVVPLDKSQEPYSVQYQALSFTGHAPPFDQQPAVECDSTQGNRTNLLVGDSVDLSAIADCTWPKIQATQIPPGANLNGLQFPNGGLFGVIRFQALVIITNGSKHQESVQEQVDGVFVYYSQTQTTIEPVQVVLTGSEVQSYLRGAGDKSIPLIAGKSTVVRVFPIRSTSDPVPAVTGPLKLLRGDTPVGEVPPMNGPIVPAQMIDRNNPDASLNYHLPLDMTNGDLTVSVDLEPPTGPPPGQQPKPPVTSLLHFVSQARRFNIKFLPYCYKPPSGQLRCPTAKIADYYSLVQKVFPVADKDGISYTPVFGQAPIWTQDLTKTDSKGKLIGPDIFLANLRRIYMLLTSLAPALGDQVGDQLVAWLPGGAIPLGNDTFMDGDSDPIWFHLTTSLQSAVGHVAFVTDVNPEASPFIKIIGTDQPPKELAHEISHNLGLRHTNASNQGGAADKASCYPYGDASIQLPAFDAAGDGFIPKTFFDLMTYNSASSTWVTPYTYDVLVRSQFNPHGDEINRGCGGAPLNIPQERDPSIQAQAPAGAASDALVISGTVDTSGTAHLDPAYHITTGTPDASDPAGPYCLRFSGNAGTLSDFCFSLPFANFETGDQLNTGPFSFQLAYPSGTTRIALRNGNRDLTSVAVSAHAPTITITSPKSGAVWNGGQQTITWTASDADGDRLFYAVQYSFDGGQNYLPIDMDLTDTQFAVDPSQLMGGAKVFFRVVATDGVNNTAATVGPIQVIQTAQLQLSGTTFELGNTSPGSAIEKRIPITNPGSGPLSITNVSIDNAAFSYSGPALPVVIPANGQFSLPVRFAPTTTNSQSGQLKLTSNASAPVASVQLTGQGFASPVADIEVAPAALDFGTVPSGQSKDLQIDIASLGSASLQISSVSISNPQFTLVGAKAPIAIPAGTEQQFTIRFAPTAAGAQSATISIASNDPTHATRSISLKGSGSSGSGGAAPQITSGGVVNGASFQAPLARGSLATLFGTNLANGIFQADRLPLPFSLGGATLTVGGIAAPIFYASQTQLNFQVPFEAPASGNVFVAVMRDGVPGNSVSTPISDNASGIFTYARTASALDPIIVHQNNTLVTPDSPAVANEALIIYATGIGALNNQPPTGAAAPLQPLAMAKVTPTVTAGGAGATVLFAGLTPGFVGLAQINIQLPAKLPSGTSLPLVLQFGNTPSQTVNLSVAGPAVGTPAISVPASLDFGSVNVGQTKDLTLAIRNTGNATLTINSVTSSNARFSTVALVTPLNISAGAAQNATIRFSPSAAGAQSGLLTISSNDPAHASTAVSLSGTGTSTGPTDTVLKVDGGAFDTEIGYPTGAASAYFVNRLTPPSYPATIKSVQLYFTTRSDGLAVKTPINIISATNPSGSTVISPVTAGSIDLVPTSISSLDTFVTYSVPQRTINSGDFVVGFVVANPVNIFPADLDGLTPSQRRSYTSTDGLNFILLDSISADIAGNLAIRAVVTLGGASETTPLSAKGPVTK